MVPLAADGSIDEPELRRYVEWLIAKGVHSPRPTVEPVAEAMHWVATPGVTSADLSTFAYAHRRRPMYPFEAETPWS